MHFKTFPTQAFHLRKAAGKWHPDKHQGVEEKKRAERIFMHVAAGYEVCYMFLTALRSFYYFFPSTTKLWVVLIIWNHNYRYFVIGFERWWKPQGVRLHVGSPRGDVWQLLQVQGDDNRQRIIVFRNITHFQSDTMQEDWLPAWTSASCWSPWSPSSQLSRWILMFTLMLMLMMMLVALVTIISTLQYYIAWFNFEAAISHLATVPKYRLQVILLP